MFEFVVSARSGKEASTDSKLTPQALEFAFFAILAAPLAKSLSPSRYADVKDNGSRKRKSAVVEKAPGETSLYDLSDNL